MWDLEVERPRLIDILHVCAYKFHINHVVIFNVDYSVFLVNLLNNPRLEMVVKTNRPISQYSLHISPLNASHPRHWSGFPFSKRSQKIQRVTTEVATAWASNRVNALTDESPCSHSLLSSCRPCHLSLENNRPTEKERERERESVQKYRRRERRREE